MSAIQDLKAQVKKELPAILANDFDGLLTDIFTGVAVLNQESGKQVLSLTYKNDLKDVPEQERHIDVFILPAGQSLGAHFHKKSSAQIYIISGTGDILIADKLQIFQENTECFFPANTIHDVRAETDTVFISCQDHPIINSDGSLDFFLA